MLEHFEGRINLCYKVEMRSFQSNRIPRPEIDETLRRTLNSGDFDLEIGAGQGLHAIAYCRARPARKLVAIERTHVRFAGLAQRTKNHPDLSNLIPVHADAVSIVTHFIPDESIADAFLLYPNPYPKTKQSNQRWHNMPFMKLLLARLKREGRLTLATNSETYALEAERMLTAEWKLELIENSILSKDHSPRTHFEKKYLERGERCWNLVFRKN
jgi:tRNA (guanine-N7-)-methyltransferase